ncbi:hypothetical protein GCK72_002812 [Caenorhabditis remanei]|uniref:Uncharacterized protein n=1 Tax=Caenorhabditis remanei TaxID=31234 RepID=A0A6A5HST1_CAERE|nr:hypothetical protein GCK72_002812 [Caenorhabditis remanei]KAF1770988.1 hypothetical protein GCK72_002812 [Caenorhabditis remanei]
MGDTNIVPVRVQNVLDMEIVRLKLWSIQFDGSIRLEGFVRNEDGTMMQKVCSEPICKRMTATMLFDISGRFFELAGQIDREYQQKKGMPSRVIDEFTNGFPENWGFLIKSCLGNESRSVMRPIQAAPREPLRQRNEPIVTLADETELNLRKNSDDLEAENNRKRREREEQAERERQERYRADEMERERIAAEKKRQEEEDADYTFRAPQSQNGEPITPIRFKRGNGQRQGVTRSVFEKTPQRGQSSSGPLAASTPQAPPPQPTRQCQSNIENREPPPRVAAPPSPIRQPPAPQPPIREPQFANDDDLFAVPKIPPPKISRGSAGNSGGNIDFLDEMDALFDTVYIDKTPKRDVKPKRPASPSPERRRYSPMPRDREMGYNDEFESSRRGGRYPSESSNMSRMSRRDETYRRNDGGMGRDESRMSRKRGYDQSPDDMEYQRRREDHYRRPDYYPPRDSRQDSKRYRPRENSSSSGRSASVRFADDYQRNRGNPKNFRDSEDSFSRDPRFYYENNRRGEPPEYREDTRKLNDILRKERELVARLQNIKSNTTTNTNTTRRVTYSSEEDEMADEWERENQEIMDNSMMFGDGISKKGRRSGPGRPPQRKPKEQPKPKSQSQPKRRNQNQSKPRRYDPVETDDLNDSIASNRPRRACVTPSPVVPKKIIWPKKDLDRLKRTIEVKKPTGSEADWIEIARLLAKNGVDGEAVKQAAITKLKWKEPRDQETIQREEEEETKRRRGVNARVKEGVKLQEELRRGATHQKRAEDVRVETTAEDIQPDDLAADQSLLAMATPVATKKRGGTRASIMPMPVEDSPIVRGSRNNSTFNSPTLNQTKAKEVETTLRYVHQLSMVQARPASRNNTSYMNKSSTRGGGSKNTSMSLEQGVKKAMKIINRGTTIHEDDEEEEESETEDEDNSEDLEEY